MLTRTAIVRYIHDMQHADRSVLAGRLEIRDDVKKIKRLKKAVRLSHFREQSDFLRCFFDECLEDFTRRHLRPGKTLKRL